MIVVVSAREGNCIVTFGHQRSEKVKIGYARQLKVNTVLANNRESPINRTRSLKNLRRGCGRRQTTRRVRYISWCFVDFHHSN